MMLKSNRAAASRQIRDELADRNKKAALAWTNNAKKRTPVGTPESTGQPGYVGGRLRASIVFVPSDGGWHEGFQVGTNVRYGVFVHNGTYDYNTDFSGAELGDSLSVPERTDAKKGMPPRPFLVQGALDSMSEFQRIYRG